MPSSDTISKTRPRLIAGPAEHTPFVPSERSPHSTADTAPKRSDPTRARAQQATVTAGAAVLLLVVLVSHAIAKALTRRTRSRIDTHRQQMRSRLDEFKAR